MLGWVSDSTRLIFVDASGGRIWVDTKELCLWAYNSDLLYPMKFCMVRVVWA